MTSMLKQRLIGAAVLIALGVIFIPMLLTGDGNFLSDDMESNVPPKPMYELEVPKVIPLDNRTMQSSDPVVEPATQVDQSKVDQNKVDKNKVDQNQVDQNQVDQNQVDQNQADKNQDVKMASAEPEGAAAKDSVTTEPATKITTDISAKVSTNASESNTEEQKAPEKNTAAPTMEKTVADKKPVTGKSTEPTSKEIEKPATTVAVTKPVVSGWAVQLGSFSVQKNAIKLRDSLRKKGYASFVEDSTKNGKTSYRVRVGPELTRELADELKKKLKAETKIDGFVVTFPAK